MKNNQIAYDKLAEKYKLAGDAHFMEFLKMMLTPEEGNYLLALDKPKTPAELAAILKQDEKTVNKKLETLTRRGLLVRGKAKYMAWGDAHQLKARTMMSGEEYSHSGMAEHRRRDERYITSPFAEIHGWFKLYEMTGKPLMRVIPAIKAIRMNPKIKPEDILWYENIEELMKSADKIGCVDCNCRRIYDRCHKPLFNCLHFGNMVDYEVGRGSRMKEITRKEAIAICHEAEEAALVHTTPGNFSALSGVICNCCSDCCSTLEPALQAGRVNEIVAPSRYQAVVNQELCKGCKACTKRCQFSAIEMVNVNGADKQKAFVNKDKCLGCGVCVIGCKQQALTFELIRPPEFIPPKPDFKVPLAYSTL